LVERLIEQDDSTQSLLESFLVGGEEQLAVDTPILLGILDRDGCEALTDGAGGFVGGEDSTAGFDDVSGGLGEFCAVLG
jgi:hypothetical protein